jgi:predicted RNA-binding protein with TRAM domain
MQSLALKLSDWRHRVRTAEAVLPPAVHPTVCPSTRTCSSSASTTRSCHSRQQGRQPAATTIRAGATPTKTQAAAAAGAAAAAAAETLSVGDVVSVSCARLGTGGVGVCLWGPSQFVLLVKGALPGEQLTAAVTAVKKSEWLCLQDSSTPATAYLSACQQDAPISHAIDTHTHVVQATPIG